MQRRAGARERAVARDEQEILQLVPIHDLQICRIVLQVSPLPSRSNWSVAAATSSGAYAMRQLDPHLAGGAARSTRGAGRFPALLAPHPARPPAQAPPPPPPQRPPAHAPH